VEGVVSGSDESAETEAREPEASRAERAALSLTLGVCGQRRRALR
jgi:hypothetical protein